MIFVTVGTELPFDRLVRPVDEWAQRHRRDDVLAQIGPTAWRPRHIRWVQFMDPIECRGTMSRADVIVAHAGMGTILTALEMGKRILVLPRRADLREVRNNHQIATARQLAAEGRLAAAFDEEELVHKLDAIDQIAVPGQIAGRASPGLLHALQQFIECPDVPAALRARPVVGLPTHQPPDSYDAGAPVRAVG